MYIPRELEKTLPPFLKRKEILAIVGARQVGKTTFLQHLLAELKKTRTVEFLTFEKEANLALFENLEDFKKYYQDCEVLILDEFHYAKDGGKSLKYLFDTTKIKFIISGSSSLELTFATGKFLVGRLLKFYLYPFSFREFLLAKDKELHRILESQIPDLFSQKFNPKTSFGHEINRRLQKYFEEYLVFGGYPAVVLAQTTGEKVKILESIFENYLLRDITALLNLKTKSELRKLAEFLAAQLGGLVNFQELSRVSALPYKDLLKHLTVLENTFITQSLKPFYQNPRTELTKTPKVYFWDNGFRNYLLLDFKDLRARADAGQLVENFVFTQLRRRDFRKINFWRTKSKAEVDFVLQAQGETIPIEVKYSPSPTPGKSFYSFLEKYSPKKAFILTQGFSGTKQIGQTQVYFAPVYYL